MKKFLAIDGREFSTSTECEKYENFIVRVMIKKIRKHLEFLQETKFTEGFENSVARQITDIIRENVGGKLANRFWSIACCSDHSEMVDTFFDGDQSLLELYDNVSFYAKENSTFVMPSWGTYGT